MRLRYAVIACKLVLILVRVMLDVGSLNLVLYVLGVDRPGARQVSRMQPVAMSARRLVRFHLESNLVSFD